MGANPSLDNEFFHTVDLQDLAWARSESDIYLLTATITSLGLMEAVWAPGP